MGCCDSRGAQEFIQQLEELGVFVIFREAEDKLNEKYLTQKLESNFTQKQLQLLQIYLDERGRVKHPQIFDLYKDESGLINKAALEEYLNDMKTVFIDETIKEIDDSQNKKEIRGMINRLRKNFEAFKKQAVEKLMGDNESLDQANFNDAFRGYEKLKESEDFRGAIDKFYEEEPKKKTTQLS